MEDNSVNVEIIDSADTTVDSIPPERRVSLESILTLETEMKNAMTRYFEANQGIDYAVTMPIALEIMLRFPYHWLVTVFQRTEDEFRMAVNHHVDHIIETVKEQNAANAAQTAEVANENNEVVENNNEGTDTNE